MKKCHPPTGLTSLKRRAMSSVKHMPMVFQESRKNTWRKQIQGMMKAATVIVSIGPKTSVLHRTQ